MQVALLRFWHCAPGAAAAASSFALVAASAERAELRLVSLPQDPSPAGGLLRLAGPDDEEVTAAHGAEPPAARAERHRLRLALHHHEARTHTLQLAGFAPPPPPADESDPEAAGGMTPGFAAAAANILPPAHLRIAALPVHTGLACPTAAAGGGCWPDHGYALCVSDNASLRAGAVLVEPPLPAPGASCGCLASQAGGAPAGGAAAAATAQWHFKAFAQVRVAACASLPPPLPASHPRPSLAAQWATPSPIQTSSCSGPHLSAALQSAASHLGGALPLQPSFELSATTLAGVETTVVPLAALTLSPAADVPAPAPPATAALSSPSAPVRAQPLLSPSAAAAQAAAVAAAVGSPVPATSPSGPAASSPAPAAAGAPYAEAELLGRERRSLSTGGWPAAKPPVAAAAAAAESAADEAAAGGGEGEAWPASPPGAEVPAEEEGRPPSPPAAVALAAAAAPSESWPEPPPQAEESVGALTPAIAASAGPAPPPALDVDSSSVHIPAAAALAALAERLANDAAARDASLVAEQLLLLQSLHASITGALPQQLARAVEAAVDAGLRLSGGGGGPAALSGQLEGLAASVSAAAAGAVGPALEAAVTTALPVAIDDAVAEATRGLPDEVSSAVRAAATASLKDAVLSTLLPGLERALRAAVDQVRGLP